MESQCRESERLNRIHPEEARRRYGPSDRDRQSEGRGRQDHDGGERRRRNSVEGNSSSRRRRRPARECNFRSRGAREASEQTTYEVLIGAASAREAIRETVVPGLYLLASDPRLAGAEVEPVREPGREMMLATALQPEMGSYEYRFHRLPTVSRASDPQRAYDSKIRPDHDTV